MMAAMPPPTVTRRSSAGGESAPRGRWTRDGLARGGWVVCATVLALALGMSGCGHSSANNRAGGEPPLPSSSASPSTLPSQAHAQPSFTGQPTISLHYAFDGGLTDPVLDAAGLLPLHIATAAGGTFTLVDHNGGGAVQYPVLCAHYGAPDCQRAIFESDEVSWLSPGQRPIRYGISVLLASSQTSHGENLLQKGFSTTGSSQFKVQIDGQAGDPSCVMVGGGSDAQIHVALSSISVADGRWHAIECDRKAELLTVSVDGVVTGSTILPEDLSVENTAPLRIGGKGTSPNNDQFNGAVDDAFVEVFG
jgi:concanavalin A-like lectin/glucanase superfamily protein